MAGRSSSGLKASARRVRPSLISMATSHSMIALTSVC